MGPIVCPKTSVTNYHYSLHNDTEHCLQLTRTAVTLTSWVAPLTCRLTLRGRHKSHAETRLLSLHLSLSASRHLLSFQCITSPKKMYAQFELCTECPRRNGQNFGRVFLRLNYTDITQNTYIQS